jgi:hypothetical protein
MNQHLFDTLASVGRSPLAWHASDGSTALVLPHGGRILGLFAPGSAENFFWTHPALASVDTAREFYAGTEWHNSGGDRTWLAPEVDFFFRQYPNTDHYHQPRALDPGDYRVVDAESLCLVNRATLLLARCQTRVELEITKRISPAPNPLRGEAQWTASDEVQYAGYTLRTALAWLDAGQAATPVGLWNLLQMPHGGTLLAATYTRAEPRRFFGTLRPEDMEVTAHLLRYRLTAAGEQKLGLRAVAVTGRVGYRYATGDGRWSLVVRNIFVDPSGTYVDVPWQAPDDRGYAVQACNVNSSLGCFSELEYHVPAIGPGTGRRSCEDVSQVWAFRGPRAAIDRVAQSLLSADA